MSGLPVSLTVGPKAGQARIVVAGQDISGAVRAVRTTMSVGEVPTITLELGMWAGPVEGEMRLLLSPHTVRMLAAFGWFPPVGHEVQANGAVLLGMPEPSSVDEQELGGGQHQAMA